MKWCTEAELRAGQMTCMAFGDTTIWLYWEPTHTGEKIKRVFVLETSAFQPKRYFDKFDAAAEAFEKIKVDNAVAIAMKAFGIPRSSV